MEGVGKGGQLTLVVPDNVTLPCLVRSWHCYSSAMCLVFQQDAAQRRRALMLSFRSPFTNKCIEMESPHMRMKACPAALAIHDDAYKIVSSHGVLHCRFARMVLHGQVLPPVQIDLGRLV